jgi:lipid-A-disaccharide synthase
MGRIYFVAGEVSGDFYGAELIEALQSQGSFQFAGWGGARMAKAADGAITDWVEKAGVMGVWEVLKQYRWFRERFHETLAQIAEFEPGVIVLIDYPGFNLRLAKAVRARFPEVRILQYVCPQVWAWKQGRIPKMARWLDQVVCLFPFEVEVLAKGGCPGIYLGHPLVEELAEKTIVCERENQLVGLFPGSRHREVERIFPVMVEASRLLRKKHPGLRFEVPAISEKLASEMRAGITQEDPIHIEVGTSHNLMQRARCAVMASGTATLEAAWFGLPYCLVYQMAPFTWRVAQRVVKVEFAGIVNILAAREVVPEFLQENMKAEVIANWVNARLTDPESLRVLAEKELAVAAALGKGGVHERVAAEVVNLLEK